MAENQIRIDDGAYRYLNSLKNQGESFNDAVHKLINEHDHDRYLMGETNE